ncbi:ArsB/NhaD family transporter [Yersinia hibernica]|uniref:ArsB/NhaD family transporter n=1 Tax=Yersinia hibernica TaxID=2339259 RepID=UPI003704AE05
MRYNSGEIQSATATHGLERFYVTGRHNIYPDNLLVIWQPKGLGIGWSAILGAALALVSGIVHVTDIPIVWNIIWNATATFIVVIIISLLLDESGFFEWAALQVYRWGNGRGRWRTYSICCREERACN